MGKPNRRTRRNTKKGKPKRLIEQPEAEHQQQRATQEQNAVRSGPPENMTGKQPDEKGNKKTDATEQQAESRSKIVRFVITKRDATVAFLDRHGGGGLG